MKLVDVVTHTEKKKLGFYFGFSTGQKTGEFIVAFEYSEGSFHLDRAVHSQHSSFCTGDVLVRIISEFYESFGYLHFSVFCSFCAAVSVRASAAIIAAIYGQFRSVSVFACPVFHPYRS